MGKQWLGAADGPNIPKSLLHLHHHHQQQQQQNLPIIIIRLMGFKLNLKWALSLHPTFSYNSSFPSSSFNGKAITYDMARLSAPSVSVSLCVLSVESETSYNDRTTTNACSSTSRISDNHHSETKDIKRSVGKRLCAGIKDDELTFLTSLQANTISRYSLLLENLVMLEDTFSDSDVAMLERDILVHLERLGASNLFPTSLSKTLENEDLVKPVVPSTKKIERKLRRERVSRKADTIFMPEFSSPKNYRRADVSVRKLSKSKGSRLKITRNEAELSRGVKVVADLERLKMMLEEETGGVASFRSWAAAAGIDKKVLLENLHFGWCCRDELLKSTRSLVLYIARNYIGLGIAFDDLIQAGNFGVLQGAERFDESRGYKFSTYVQYWVRKSMSMLMSRHGRGIRIPFTLSKAMNQIQKARKALQNSHGKDPGDDTIAKFTGLSLAKIASASKCPRVVGSIDRKIGHYVGVKFLELTPDPTLNTPEEMVMKQQMRTETYCLMKGLDVRETKVLGLRFGLGGCERKSLDEIGRGLGVSKEWVRKIERRALTKLRLKDGGTLQSLRHYLYV